MAHATTHVRKVKAVRVERVSVLQEKPTAMVAVLTSPAIVKVAVLAVQYVTPMSLATTVSVKSLLAPLAKRFVKVPVSSLTPMPRTAVSAGTSVKTIVCA